MTKQKKLRHLEYYDLQDTFDKLYADSKNNKIFTKLMQIIASEENIKLAYRNIKSNVGSKTSGVDKVNINDIEKLNSQDFIEMGNVLLQVKNYVLMKFTVIIKYLNS